MLKTILVIDDSGHSRELLYLVLKESGLFDRCLTAKSCEEGLKQLREDDVDVIVCALHIPRSDGLKFLREVTEDPSLEDIPVVMITGNVDQEEKTRWLNLGAGDYVTRPFDPAELIARIRVQLKIKTLQDALREQANTDPLTLLCNRRCMFERLAREKDRSLRTGKPLTLAMIDIDHFKTINDTYGHTFGDMVLVEFARLLERELRPYDQAARFGGGEFALILPETNLNQAWFIAERIRNVIGNISFSGHLREVRLTISIGLAPFPAPGVNTLDDLVREADNALYRAKDSGRNRVVTGHSKTARPGQAQSG